MRLKGKLQVPEKNLIKCFLKASKEVGFKCTLVYLAGKNAVIKYDSLLQTSESHIYVDDKHEAVSFLQDKKISFCTTWGAL